MEMETFLLLPPVAFMLYLILTFGVSALAGRLSAKGEDSESKKNSYACGENVTQNRGQPDYSEFFKFAFFFTLMHIVVLVVAMDPTGTTVPAVIYLGVIGLSLFILLRK